MGQREAAVEAERAHIPSLPPFSLWIDQTSRPGWTNMAIDLALLDRAEHQGESWLRLYTWNPHCLSFGRHEPAATRYDIDRIQALGLDTVRRPTGGRAVWHARELTYAVVAPCTRFGSLRGAYLEIHRLLGDALTTLGIGASLAPPIRIARLDAGACFSQPVGGEVLVDGRKVIGSAQLRRGSALLQHGSILLHDDQPVVTGLLRNPKRADRADAATRAAAALLPYRLGRPLLAREVAVAVVQSAARHWAGTVDLESDAEPILRAAFRHYPQFRSSAWTWIR